jgi:[ribosomal protein S5]-alanine N-acetyltransferase
MPPARFVLEERRVAQAAELFEVLRDPRLYEFLDEDPPTSVQALAEKLARSERRLSPDGKQHWLNWVIRVESGAIAGCIQATVEENKETNIAYVLSPEFQGRGIATAAVRQMLEIAVNQYHATTLFIVAEAANLASLRLAERLGFVLAPSEIAAKRAGGPNDVVYWLQATPSEA